MLLAGDMSEVMHPLSTLLAGKKLILGSRSPRRVQLLKELGLTFECRVSDAPEEHDNEIEASKVPELLALRKAKWLMNELSPDELLITADTIVILDHKIIEKPTDLSEAKQFLSRLSDRWHTVITGYALSSTTRQISESVESKIRFGPLEDGEIEYYLSQYEVLDKAGAYGVQDWIGLIGVMELQGSYHNVMGLPTAKLYQSLKDFLLTW